MVEYLDPSIAGEGIHVDQWRAPEWMDTPDVSAEEWQPDIEPPHINDYSSFKKHKHYRQYFRPYRYVPWPAFMYHPTLGEKVVKSKDEAIALGPEWSGTPPAKKRIDMAGKSLPVKSDTQRLAEVVAQALGPKQGATVDTNMIGAIVAAVMAAMKADQAQPAPAATAEIDPETLIPPLDGKVEIDESIERKALLELAEKEGIKVDRRLSNQKIKEALGL